MSSFRSNNYLVFSLNIAEKNIQYFSKLNLLFTHEQYFCLDHNSQKFLILKFEKSNFFFNKFVIEEFFKENNLLINYTYVMCYGNLVSVSFFENLLKRVEDFDFDFFSFIFYNIIKRKSLIINNFFFITYVYYNIFVLLKCQQSTKLLLN